jgi:DNA-binding response OmpR family regulator
MVAPVVMLVDDEVPLVETIAKRLERRKILTFKAYSGEECLATLESNPNIDVIVLDVKMPGMDGIDTLKEIKKLTPITEVIMLTGHASIESGVKGLQFGAFDYLMKPCVIDDLVEKINGAAQKKQVHEQKIDNWGRFMETSTLEELMVPLDEYATVSEDANILEAVLALETAQKSFHPGRYRHRAVLVLDKDGRVIGKLSQHDIIQALEPQYKEIRENQSSASDHFGFSRAFIESVSLQYHEWDKPLQNIYRKALDQKVGTFMYRPTKLEHIALSATINETIHRLIVGEHHSLLVTDGPDIVGVVRLTDVFELIRLRLKTLHLAAKIAHSGN